MPENRLEIIKKYLKTDNISLETLKTLTGEQESKNLIKNLLNIEREYLVYCDIKSSPPKYKIFSNIKNLILMAKESEEITNFTPYIGKVRKFKKNLKFLEDKLIERELYNDDWKEFITQISDDIEYYEMEFMSKAQEQYKNNNYEFLSYIIYEVKSKNHLKQVLALSPHYINTRNDDKKHIVIDLIENFVEEIKKQKKNNINTILYFESIIEEFMENSRFKLTDEERNNVEKIISETREYFNINRNNIKNFKQKEICIKDIEDRLNSNNITRQKIEKLNFKYNINNGFSQNVQSEISHMEINPNSNIITIDGIDTLDMDDALSIEKKDGIYKLNVYIADVAKVIHEGMYLDLEAKKRTSTIYLSDNIIPMFPFELSNNILSLNTNNYKDVIVYEMYIDEKGKIINKNITKRQVLISNKLSYNDVNNIIVNGSNNKNLETTILNLSELSNILKKNNTKKDWYKEIEDFYNIISGVHKKETSNKDKSPSEVIVEEIMILTNMLTALIFSEKGLPFIYRVHPNIKDTKDYESLKFLEEMVNTEFEHTNTKAYLKIIESLINLYPKAYYSTDNIGHFGIDVKYYSHSTSPIRRYPDLLVQRLIHDLIFEYPTDEKIMHWEEQLIGLCEHLNTQSEINYSYQCEYEKLKKLIRKEGK